MKKICYLRQNKFVGHVKWSTNEFGLASKNLRKNKFRKNVESILIENNFNYRRFPSDFLHGLLSKHVYDMEMHTGNSIIFKEEHIDYQEKLNDWKIKEIF